MDSRKRFLETMKYGKPDRVPLFLEGMRDQVFETWNQPGLKTKQDLHKYFSFDRHEEIYLDLDPYPEFKAWPTTSAELEILKNHYNPNDPARWPDDWTARVSAWQNRTHVLMLRVHKGFFQTMGVEEWDRFSQLMIEVVDTPELVRAWMTFQGDFVTQMIRRVLRDVSVDAVIFSEPISGNDGPLISPEMHEEFVLKSYQPLLDMLPKLGVNTIILRTYANARSLLPAAVDYGFNCIWACETNPIAMDYLDIRRDLGSELRLIAGIDLDILLSDRQSIQEKVQRIVLPLLAQGAYIPLLDGRVREYLPFENYRLYREILAEIC